MLGSRAWCALMRRNFVYRRRNWISSILELVLPACFIGILVAIKNAAENSSSFDQTVRDPTFPSDSNAWTPFSFRDYVTVLRADKVCTGSKPLFDISGIASGGSNWPVPLAKCDSDKCETTGQDAQLFCEYGMIAVAGENSGGAARATAFKDWVEQEYPSIVDRDEMPFNHSLIQMFDDSDAMDDYVGSSEYGTNGFPKIVMGIVFDGADNNDWSYRLRQNSTNYNAPEQDGESRPAVRTTPDTSILTDSFARRDDVCTPEGGTASLGTYQNSCTGQYAYNGVLTFQRLVNDFILVQTGAVDQGYQVAQAGVQFVPFPTRAYVESGFYGTLGDFGPLLVVLGLLYPVACMISYICREKELRQKELMKMMSVTESDIGWSWFVTFLCFHIITATFAAWISAILFENSSGLWLWVFWMLSIIAMIVFCMAMAALTSKTTRGVLIGLLVFFVGVFLPLAVSYKDGKTSTVQLISLHPVAAFNYGLSQIGQLEDNQIGLSSSSLDISESRSGYSFQDNLSILFVDILLWSVVYWYLNRVIRPDYGQALPPWFLFTKNYWCPQRSHLPKSDTTVDQKVAKLEIPYEPVGENMKRQVEEGKTIEIHDLRKNFGEQAAVDGLSLSMYSGEITALLGHNGAGKTTTINMLTGAMAPTDGYATVAGKDIRTDLQGIRQDIGICLQHDCLFPGLTVREHIQFFSRLKGLYHQVSKSEAEAQIDQAIRDVALFEKRNTFSRNLSGGMKRKLSVAIAFCGGSKVVLLDEPTSGMDPFSRRFTWNVIRSYRQDRCIILTTHFMDEADILGDRIAIMAEGQLRCAGSSLFLKKKYGVGYQLTIEKARSGGGSETMQEKSLEDGDTDVESNYTPTNGNGHVHKSVDLEELVESAVPEATLLNNVGTEVRYQLPLGAASKFPALFQRLDDETEIVSSYGVSMTTLDEVFLLVARGDHAQTEKEHLRSSMRLSVNESGRALDSVSENLDEPSADKTDQSLNATGENFDAEQSGNSKMKLENKGLFFRHLGALFKKRAANFRRDKRAWLCTTILPTLFVLIGFLVFKFASAQRNLDPITLDFSAFNTDISKAPIMPVPFNSPNETYVCQPGNCIYTQSLVNEPQTNENYALCGSQAQLNSAASCSITQSEPIMSTVNGFEDIVPIETAVTGIQNSSKDLLETSNIYDASQYGSIWYTRDSFSRLGSDNGTLLGTLFSDQIDQTCEINSSGLNYTTVADCDNFQGVGYVIQYNFTGLHTGPLFQALADQALARYATVNQDITITTTIAPLPITKIEQSYGEGEDALLAWVLVVLSFPFIGGAFAVFVVMERESKAKHLQTVAGVEATAYWISTFLWDTLNYQIPCWTTVALMFIFEVNVLTTTERDALSGIIALLFFFGPASAGFSYCISFAFTSPSLCNVAIIISGFIIGLGGPLTVLLLQLFALGDSNEKLENAATIVTWVLRIFPTFNLGKGILFVLNIQYFVTVEEDIDLSAWSESILLVEVIYLAVQGLVYTGLAILLDVWSNNPNMVAFWQTLTCGGLCAYNQGPDITTALPEDDDVIAEQDRVLAEQDRIRAEQDRVLAGEANEGEANEASPNAGEANGDLIVISQLSKIYGNGKIAVNNLSLGIPPGECFGLLGINGAGKTTVMGVLTAEFPPSAGDAILAGFSVTREPQKIRRRIGYCPQFDAHFANLTGREHVELYASIKGVPMPFVKEAASTKLAEVGLNDRDSDKLCSNYSGGMKRRLSLACATIGSPQIVFLDECSTGVDPVARREIWKLVSDMVAGDNVPPEQRTSVVLTTHSMEECEALCPRIGIMANGRLRCLGSAQHLKSKFGQGYQVEMKANLPDHEDEDYMVNGSKLAASKGGVPVGTEAGHLPEYFYTYDESVAALNTIMPDGYLASLVSASNPVGYSIYKDSTSVVGVTLVALATFATTELRMQNIANFLNAHFPKHVLRERQDTKARYEVSSEGVRISEIFQSIEENKESLYLSDYGVSQTSLEQVFNMHAAEAERLKQGRDDH